MLSMMAHHNSAFGQFSSPPITTTAPRIEYVQFWLEPATPSPQNQTTTATATNQSTTTRTADNCALTYVYCEDEAVGTPPPTLAPRPSPSQQPPTTTPSPTTTPPPQPTTPPPPTAGTTTTTDPELQRFDQIANGCKATIQRLYPGAQTLEDIFLVPPQGATSSDFRQMTQCNQLLNQAIAQYCNILQTYDAAKCAYVNTPEILALVDMTAIIAESDFLYSPEGLAGNLPLLGGGQ